MLPVTEISALMIITWLKLYTNTTVGHWGQSKCFFLCITRFYVFIYSTNSLIISSSSAIHKCNFCGQCSLLSPRGNQCPTSASCKDSCAVRCVQQAAPGLVHWPSERTGMWRSELRLPPVLITHWWGKWQHKLTEPACEKGHSWMGGIELWAWLGHKAENRLSLPQCSSNVCITVNGRFLAFTLII